MDPDSREELLARLPTQPTGSSCLIRVRLGGAYIYDKDGMVRPWPLLAEIRQQTIVLTRC